MTDTDPIRRRVEYLLRLCDGNGDDVLDVSDFEEWVDRLAALRGWEPGSDGYTSLSTLFIEGAWAGVLATVGRDDGRVTLEGMRDFLIEVAQDHPPQVREWADVLFGLLDRDGDGAIGREEYRDLLASLCIPRAAADAAFSHVGAGATGRLTRPEFRELYRGFFLEEDPDAPASWFWGRPPPPDALAELRRARRPHG